MMLTLTSVENEVDATFDMGVLTVAVPKIDAARPCTIEVTSS